MVTLYMRDLIRAARTIGVIEIRVLIRVIKPPLIIQKAPSPQFLNHIYIRFVVIALLRDSAISIFMNIPSNIITRSILHRRIRPRIEQKADDPKFIHRSRRHHGGLSIPVLIV